MCEIPLLSLVTYQLSFPGLRGSPLPQTYGTSRWLATLALPCAYRRPAGSSILMKLMHSDIFSCITCTRQLVHLMCEIL